MAKFHANGIKKGKKGVSPWVDELRDSRGISTENHQQMFHRLVAAGFAGVHNKPGPPKPRKSK